MKNTRNFWIELDVDGRQTRVETGPAARNGEFRGTIYIRDEGEVLRAVDLQGHVLADGQLSLVVTPVAPEAKVTEQIIDGQGAGFIVSTKR
jgi:hypothetical protein